MNSSFLTKQKETLKELVNRLSKKFKYVSILGTDTLGREYRVNRAGIILVDSMWVERGFVLRVYNGKTYSEFSFNDFSKVDIDRIEKQILNEIKLSNSIKKNSYVKITKYPILEEEEMSKSFVKEYKKIEPVSIVDRMIKIKDSALQYSNLSVNFMVNFEEVNISKIFISTKKNLEQSYSWGTGSLVSVVRKDDDTKYFYEGYSSLNPIELLDLMEKDYKRVIEMSIKLLDTKRVEPGEYDVICSPDISGLIAHEAFGHGVEMDMFVKNRAKAVEYLNKQVASNLVTMHDGATAGEEVSSYAFDDEGTLGSDTIIIRDGILEKGISDSLSALRLGTKPTGNGKRQSFERKAYARMTNTFFSPGESNLNEMIESIKEGYLITGTMSGMEDPKNWGIQCIAIMGEEIIDGKLTGKIISPVYITGYVPDVLKSISMVSKDLELFGTGICGKGYKELVKASDGGPYIKTRVRLG